MGAAVPLRWFGGKYYLAPAIVDMMATQPHLHYVEPFFGGGAVLLNRNPGFDWSHTGAGCSEVVNDINHELINFWRILAHKRMFQEFHRILQVTPFSEEEWLDSRNPRTTYTVENAVAFFVRCRQSYAGGMKSFAPVARNRTRGGINEQVNAWLSAIDKLPEIHARLRTVLILQRDALELIPKQDSPQTLFYCDPPYLHSTRETKDGYTFEMCTEQHAWLLSALGVIQGKFILSGYPSEMYNTAAERFGWRHRDIAIDNKFASGESKDIMVERIWSNF